MDHENRFVAMYDLEKRYGPMPPHEGGPHARALMDLRSGSLADLEEARNLRRRALRNLRDAASSLEAALKVDQEAAESEVAVRALEADAMKADR